MERSRSVVVSGSGMDTVVLPRRIRLPKLDLAKVEHVGKSAMRNIRSLAGRAQRVVDYSIKSNVDATHSNRVVVSDDSMKCWQTSAIIVAG
jgi:hypothetical protein